MKAPAPPIAPSRLKPLLRPLDALLSAGSAGGVVLLISALIALAWANSPWGDTYEHFWHIPLDINIAGRTHSMSLQHWVNDGLMVVFFLLVGLEIKREMLIGELASPRRAFLPIAAAVGGMVVPASVYASMLVGLARRVGGCRWRRISRLPSESWRLSDGQFQSP